jgi:GNAT superfamily N-acetyltransferase
VATTGEAARAEPAPTPDVAAGTPLGESRWPPVVAVLVFMALNIALRIWLPSEGAIRVPWVLPAIEAALLAVLLTSDPSAPHERRRLRRVALVVVAILVAAALWATALLVDDLIRGQGVSNAPRELLASGAVVWLGNNLAFALLYWLMDGGGPIARSRRAAPVDFAFTQHMSPELAPPGWRPIFLDYLHLGFTNATAFSPTDVMPLTHRAKYAMLVQSTVALALFGLVVARAVNAFT